MYALMLSPQLLPPLALSLFLCLSHSLPSSMPCALCLSLPESQELPPSQREGESTTLPVPDSYLGWRPSRVLRPAPPIVMAYFHTCCLPLVWQDHARKSEPAAGLPVPFLSRSFHSSTHSLIHSFTHSLIHSFIQSFTHSFSLSLSLSLPLPLPVPLPLRLPLPILLLLPWPFEFPAPPHSRTSRAIQVCQIIQVFKLSPPTRRSCWCTHR